jgi:uncharacterized RDD family membrane protein YckC
VALARAGKEVYFAGAVGNDGGMLLEALAADGIHDRYIKRTDGASGHAVIQVDPKGQNCIIILPGANGEITQADVDAMTPEQLANIEAASAALAADPEAIYAWNMIIYLIIIMVSISLLLSYLLLEFTVPLLLRNGQTVGKKVFGVAVMRCEGIRVNGVCMFIRTVLGKFAIETMIPIMMLLMLYFGAIGLTGLLIGGGIILVEIVLLIATKDHSMIHDKLANTVTVDLASQMIFETPEDLITYKQKIAAEKAAQQSY